MYSGPGFSPAFSRIVSVCVYLILSAVCTTAARAQFEPANRVQLVVHVFVDSLQEPAPPTLNVQLLDEFGTIEKESHTDSRGVVEFQTKTTTKRLRIYGPGVQEYNEILEIESMERRKDANIVVKAAPSASPTGTNASTQGMISASRMKVPEKAERELQKGKEAGEQKDWTKAKKHFEAAIAIYPDYDVAYNGLGQALASGGDAGAARAAFEKAIQINDNFAAAYRNLARISLSEHNFDETDNLLTRSLAAEPLNAWALAYSAYAELQLHKFDDAIAHARKAHMVPHDGLASVHIVAGRALEEKQQMTEAVEEYRLYLREDANGRDAERAHKAIARLSGEAPK
jgi:tetratricopeptide (TPR) repeat protein